MRVMCLGMDEFANNGWLQELPHPVTKVVWDNYAAVGPKLRKISVWITTICWKFSWKPHSKAAGVCPAGNGRRVVAIEARLRKDLSRYSRIRSGSKRQCSAEPRIIGRASGSFPGQPRRRWMANTNLVTTMEHNFVDEPMTRGMQTSRGIIREGTS